jgi:hypothetical protein
MHKITNFAGGVRHGWEMPFGANRSQVPQPHPADLSLNQAYKRPQAPTMPQQFPPGTPISLCFKVPFNNTLPGPETDRVIYSSRGALERWSQPAGSPDDAPTHKLPVHVQHVDDLRARCSRMKAEHGVEATVTVGRARTIAPAPGLQPTPTNNVVANVCLHGPDYESARRAREALLNQSPITMVRHRQLCGVWSNLTICSNPRPFLLTGT